MHRSFLFLLFLSSSILPLHSLPTKQQRLQTPQFAGHVKTPTTSRASHDCQAPNNGGCGIFSCCANACCPAGLDYCPTFGNFCVDRQGNTNCEDRISGAPFRGRPCDLEPTRCCGVHPNTNICAIADSSLALGATNDDVVVCVNEKGFVACGNPLMPGVLCQGGGCCQNPGRCCLVGDVMGCCPFGDGGPIEIIADVSIGPLVSAEPGEPIDLEFPSLLSESPGVIDVNESPNVEYIHDMPSESPEVSEPSMKPDIVVPLPSLPPALMEESMQPEFSTEEFSASPEETESMQPEFSMEEMMEISPSPEVTFTGVEVTVLEEDGSVCFPGRATVDVRGKGVVNISELRIGDVVQSGEQTWSEVIIWTHYDKWYNGRRYVRVGLEGGTELTATVGHIVWIWEKNSRTGIDIEKVGIGMEMWVVGSGRRKVMKVERVMEQGLFNPQTASGDIVVDGVLVSCYTKWVDMGLAHSLLAPVRAGYKAMTAVWSR